MYRLTATVCGAVLAAGALAIPTAASAETSCTAWASMPGRVALAGKPVTVRMTLRGSAGCHTDGVDNGATATLRGPGAKDPQRWSRFGDTDTQTFQLRVNRLGSYTLGSGHVQVYNSAEQLVPATWRPTTVDVVAAARFRGLHRSGDTVYVTAESYGDAGWRGRDGVYVVLEKRSASGWKPVVQVKSTRDGRVGISGLHRDAHYRVTTQQTSTTAPATSRQV